MFTKCTQVKYNMYSYLWMLAKNYFFRSQRAFRSNTPDGKKANIFKYESYGGSVCFCTSEWWWVNEFEQTRTLLKRIFQFYVLWYKNPVICALLVHYKTNWYAWLKSKKIFKEKTYFWSYVILIGAPHSIVLQYPKTSRQGTVRFKRHHPHPSILTWLTWFSPILERRKKKQEKMSSLVSTSYFEKKSFFLKRGYRLFTPIVENLDENVASFLFNEHIWSQGRSELKETKCDGKGDIFVLSTLYFFR